MALCYMGTFQSTRLNRTAGYPGLWGVVYERPALLILGKGRGRAGAQGVGPGAAGAEGPSRRQSHVANAVRYLPGRQAVCVNCRYLQAPGTRDKYLPRCA
jgi:hypothetical protein